MAIFLGVSLWGSFKRGLSKAATGLRDDKALGVPFQKARCAWAAFDAMARGYDENALDGRKWGELWGE